MVIYPTGHTPNYSEQHSRDVMQHKATKKMQLPSNEN